MGSVLRNMKDSTVTMPFGKKANVPQFMQFVPGRAEIVVLDPTDYFAKGSDLVSYAENVNSIIAFPYYNKIKRRAELYKDGNWDNYRYFPLLRGMYEMPAQGDPVLLCTIGGQNFFLGPLNTENNVNWNEDLLLGKMFPAAYSKDSGELPPPTLTNLAFQKEKQRVKLQKIIDKTVSDVNHLNLDNPKGSANITHTHGDLMLEGRHGNSIRVGSRYKDPYIILSNGLGIGDRVETLGIGSTLALIEKGSLYQHFQKYNTEVGTGEGIINTIRGLHLASDKIKDNNRNLQYSLHLTENLSEDFTPSQEIYLYNRPQILIDSHRITLNSKDSDMYLSANPKIHMAAKKDITITAGNDLIINSKYTYLGAPSKIHHYNVGLDDGDENKNTDLPVPEPMILGEQLYTVLNELVDCLASACYVGPLGSPLPLVDPMMVQIANADNPKFEISGSTDAAGNPLGRRSLTSIKDKLESIKSIYHFIENNDEEKNPTQGESSQDESTGGSAQ